MSRSARRLSLSSWNSQLFMDSVDTSGGGDSGGSGVGPAGPAWDWPIDAASVPPREDFTAVATPSSSPVGGRAGAPGQAATPPVVILLQQSHLCSSCGRGEGEDGHRRHSGGEGFLGGGYSHSMDDVGGGPSYPFDGLWTPPSSPTEPSSFSPPSPSFPPSFPLSPVTMAAAAVGRRLSSRPAPRECKFCRNNGEAAATYTSHTLRCPQTQKLICPVLRSHVCEICGQTGDQAHTRNYCPDLSRDERMRRSLPSQLCATRRQASGIRHTAGAATATRDEVGCLRQRGGEGTC